MVRKYQPRRYKKTYKKRAVSVPGYISRGKLLGTIYRFKRTNTALYPVAKSFTNQTAQFKLSDIPNFSEFVALFDQYKILGVGITWIFTRTENQISTTVGQNPMPNLGYVRDYNDATPLTSEGNYLQFQDCRIRRLDRPISMYVRPRPSTALYNGAFTGYGVPTNVWIDTASSDVQHYGVKWFTDASMEGSLPTEQLGVIKMVFRFYLAFRNVK